MGIDVRDNVRYKNNKTGDFHKFEFRS